MFDIYDHFEDIEMLNGSAARQEAEKHLWHLYNDDRAAFDDYIQKHNINLEAYIPYEYAETAFEMWCEDMEGGE